MSELVRFGVSLDESLLKDFDKTIKDQGYENRSKAIKDLINKYVAEKEWNSDGFVAGAITISYDHHLGDTLYKLMDLQHSFHEEIISIQHIHLDHDNCLEILAIKGESSKVRKLYESLKSMRGIIHADVSIITAG